MMRILLMWFISYICFTSGFLSTVSWGKRVIDHGSAADQPFDGISVSGT